MKTNYLPNIANRVFNTPLLITDNKLMEVLEVLGDRILFDVETAELVLHSPSASVVTPYAAKKVSRIEGDQIAVVPISGTLTHKPMGIEALSGVRSYQNIRNDLESAMSDTSIGSILLDISSPGGEVAGLFDLVDDIYRMRSEKPIIALSNEGAYSAAYAIASAANKVFLTRTAGVGSVGVIAVHRDISKWAEKTGVKYTPIYAGARKNDFSPYEPLTKESLEIMQARVNTVWDIFTATVARNNGLTQQQVKDMQAAIYFGEAAVESGLADGIKSYRETITYMQTEYGGRKMPKRTTESAGAASSENQVVTQTETQEIETGAAETEGQKVAATVEETGTKPPENLGEQFIKAERARVQGIMAVCGQYQLSELSSQFINDGASVESVEKTIQALLAERSKAQSVVSQTKPAGTGEVSPLVANAQRRAKDFVSNQSY